MSWTHVKAVRSEGLEEQYIFRPGGAPLCSLRRDPDDAWQTRLLCLEGVSCNVLWLPSALTLEEAKRASEEELARMGHRWDGLERVQSERKREGRAWLGKRSW